MDYEKTNRRFRLLISKRKQIIIDRPPIEGNDQSNKYKTEQKHDSITPHAVF